MKNFKTKFFTFFQNLGKTFMFPVATLAFMGILLGLGSSITSSAVIEKIPFLGNKFIQLFFNYLTTIGSFGFTYLPVMFAMAIPFGMCKRNKGVGTFAGFAGFTAMNMSINFYLKESNTLSTPETLKASGQGFVFGIQTIEMGVLGGIIAGIIVFYLCEKFQDFKMPDAFSFFSGIRFVPIISVLTLSIIGLFIPIIWPIFSNSINSIGYLIQKAGIFGPFLYGLGLAILKPFGMHHILLAMVRFTPIGGTEIVNGTEVSGALNIFYSQLKAGAPISHKATAFLSQGFMPTFMFALPAVAFAIYSTSRLENKNAIKGLLISGILVSFVTGISEPIEFLFLFIAPTLYIFHSIMQGLSLMVVALANVSIGNTDGGIIDFIIFGMLQGLNTKWYLILIIGFIWFVIYFIVFRWYILKYNIPTPGREEKSDDNDLKIFSKGNGIYDAKIFIKALGGKHNIKELDNCVTRLRLVLDDITKIDELTLKKAGSLSIVKIDNHNLQIIIGAQVQSLKTNIESELNNE